MMPQYVCQSIYEQMNPEIFNCHHHNQDIKTLKSSEKLNKSFREVREYFLRVAKMGALVDFVLSQGSQGEMHLPLAILFFHRPVYELLL